MNVQDDQASVRTGLQQAGSGQPRGGVFGGDLSQQDRVGLSSDDAGVGQDQVQVTPTRVSPEQEPRRQVETGEAAPWIEMKEEPIPTEVAEYVEKVEKENLELERPVVHEGKPIVDLPGGGDEIQVTIPLTQAQMEVSLKEKVSNSARWLAEWCLRIVKKFSGRAFYAPEEEKVRQ